MQIMKLLILDLFSSDNVLGSVFIVLFFFMAYYVFKKYMKGRSLPYYICIKLLVKKEKYANNFSNEEALKEVNLEKLWVSYIEGDYVNRYIRENGLRLYQMSHQLFSQDIKSQKYFIMSEVEADELQLPNSHNLKEKPKAYNFFVSIVDKCQESIMASKYCECYFIPKIVIPFPKSYLLFAVDYLLSKNLHAEEKHNYGLTKKILIERLIDISPDLLPVDFKENVRFGNEMLKGK